MKIIVVTNLYPNPVEPTKGVFTELILNYIRKKYHVDVLVPVPWFPKSKVAERFSRWYKKTEIPKVYSLNGQIVHVFRYPYIPRVGGPIHAFLMFINLYLALKKLHQANSYDCINARWIYPDGVATVLVALKLKLPVVLTAQGCDINRYSYMASRKQQITWALKHSNAIIAVSNAIKKRMIEIGADVSKISVISNGVDLEKFKIRGRGKIRKILKLDENIKYIFFVGSLEEVKGVDTLLDAVLILKNKYGYKFKLLMAGEGYMKSSIEKFIARYYLSDYITLLGTIPHEQIALFMSACNLLCLPSIREGHPNVVNEALSSGIPVVGSAVGAIPELLNEQSGIIVTPGNANGLAEALSDAMMKNWDADIIRSQIAGNTWQKSSKKYANVLTSILN